MPNAALVDESSSPNDKAFAKKTGKTDCKCDKTDRPVYDQQTSEQKVLDEIEFENILQNFLYVPKKKNSTSSKQNNTNVIDDLPKENRKRRYIELDELDEEMDSVLMRHVRSLNTENGIESVTANFRDNDAKKKALNHWENKTTLDLTGTYYKHFSTEVNATTTEYRFTNLRHFSLYTISVRACREMEEGDTDIYATCSNWVYWDKKTLKKRTYLK